MRYTSVLKTGPKMKKIPTKQRRRFAFGQRQSLNLQKYYNYFRKKKTQHLSKNKK